MSSRLSTPVNSRCGRKIKLWKFIQEMSFDSCLESKLKSFFPKKDKVHGMFCLQLPGASMMDYTAELQ